MVTHFSEKTQKADLTKKVSFSTAGFGIDRDLPHTYFNQINRYHSLHSTPLSRKLPNGPHLFSLHLQQTVKEDRKQPRHPNGFIPLFLWAFIRTKSTQQHWAGAALYRVNIMISPTFFSGRDRSPDCKAVLGHTGQLLQSSAELRHFWVLPLHLLLPSTGCPGSPLGSLAHTDFQKAAVEVSSSPEQLKGEG